MVYMPPVALEKDTIHSTLVIDEEVLRYPLPTRESICALAADKAMHQTLILLPVFLHDLKQPLHVGKSSLFCSANNSSDLVIMMLHSKPSRTARK